MNKAKLFILIITSVICFSMVAIVILLYSISSRIDLKWDENILVPPSYIQSEVVQDIKGESTQKYLVVDVVDGDTIKVMENGIKKTIRLIGIDAPEVKTKECMYQEATTYLENIILNKEVVLEADSTQTDLDKYGRQLRYIYIDGNNINEEIIKNGLASEYTYSKAYKYKPEFLQAEQSAMNSQIGIWSSFCLTK